MSLITPYKAEKPHQKRTKHTSKEVLRVSHRSGGDLDAIAMNLLSKESAQEVLQKEEQERKIMQCKHGLRKKNCETCPFVSDCPVQALKR